MDSDSFRNHGRSRFGDPVQISRAENPYLGERIVEPTELVDGRDAVRYNTACDYAETSDYGILAEEIDSSFGIKGKKILEIGPGPGNLCEELSKKGAGLVVGVDGATTMIDYVKDKFNEQIREGRMDFALATVYDLPFPPEFDLVVCQNSLHQLYEPGRALQEMIRVTSSDGTVYIADFRRDVTQEALEERASYTRPEIREDLVNSVKAALTKQEVRELLAPVEGISFSVTDAEDPRGLSEWVDNLIEKDPVPHFRDYLISMRIEIHKGRT